jgi:hypothetical protein
MAEAAELSLSSFFKWKKVKVQMIPHCKNYVYQNEKTQDGDCKWYNLSRTSLFS